MTSLEANGQTIIDPLPEHFIATDTRHERGPLALPIVLNAAEARAHGVERLLMVVTTPRDAQPGTETTGRVLHIFFFN